MEKDLFEEYKNMIPNIVKSGTPMSEKAFKQNLQNKLLNIFTIGDYYYMIANLESFKYDFVHPNLTTVLGYSVEDFNFKSYFDAIHPEDVSYYLDYEQTVVHFFSKLTADKVLKYKTRFDFRIRKADGNYIRILHQVVPVQIKDDGGIISTLVVHTDISYLKTTNKSTLSFIGLEGEPSYINFKVDTIFTPTLEILTKREKEILYLLAEGKSSFEISELIFISKVTVDRHRNNMLAKTKTKNVSGLIKSAINEGWI